jgi:flavin reductase
MSSVSTAAFPVAGTQLDVDKHRGGLRRVASTVHIIAVKVEDGFFATTATAVASVSFDPPTMLVCLNSNSVISRAIERESYFSISVLGAEQQDIAAACAGGIPHAEREKFFEVSSGLFPVPVVRGAEASFVCRRRDISVQGSHFVVFGDVADANFDASVQPLIYLDGAYGSFLPA